jgi:hypothetical protein
MFFTWLEASWAYTWWKNGGDDMLYLYVMSNQSESSLVFNTTTGALENGR